MAVNSYILSGSEFNEKAFCDNMDKHISANMVKMLQHDLVVIDDCFKKLECFYVKELLGDLHDEIIKQLNIYKKWDESLNDSR